jgi:hypothetical protein
MIQWIDECRPIYQLMGQVIVMISLIQTTVRRGRGRGTATDFKINLVTTSIATITGSFCAQIFVMSSTKNHRTESQSFAAISECL